MPKVRIVNGVNLRLTASDLDKTQALLMQNYDMGADEIVRSINGSVKFHGSYLGTNAPTLLHVNYNDEEKRNDILACCDEKILVKAQGSNEFTALISTFTPNVMRSAVTIRGKSYIANPKDGLYEYDGVSTISKINDIKLRDIVVLKEVNRCFGITDNNELVWTDDLTTMGGTPQVWDGENIDTIPPTDGDRMEKLWVLNGRLIILCTNSIWTYYVNGSPENWRLEKETTSVGCIAPQTAKQPGGEIWFLGYSPSTGRGVYGFDGTSARLLSYDITPFLDKINESRIHLACAEYVGNLYKLSFAYGQSLENDYTFHFDTIRKNKLIDSPNIYGPHTYGFSASTILNTRDFHGEHIFARKATDGGRVYRTAPYMTQYSDELADNGSLIPSVLLTGIFDTEVTSKGQAFDATWFKRYGPIFLEHSTSGSWGVKVEILKDYDNETYQDIADYLEGDNYPLEVLDVDSYPINFRELNTDFIETDIVSDAIQFRITNHVHATKSSFRALSYDFKPVRRKKNAELVKI